MSKVPTPRRRNAQATRDAIIEAARLRFMGSAYEQVSLRDVAAAAGIDPALVIRYFGSKEGLFERVLTHEVTGPQPEVMGDRATFGARVGAAFMQNDGIPARYETINTAIWSAASPTAAKIVKRDIEERFVKPIAAQLEGPDAEVRAALIVSLLVGTTILHRMLGVPPLDQDDMSRVTPHLAAVLQHLADGD